MKSFVIALRIFLFFTILTGLIYPLLVTSIAQLMFPSESNGSITYRDNTPVGSLLIGQSFDSSAIYFISRPSAISYNPIPSGGSNYGLTSRKLKEQFDRRKQEFITANMLYPQAEIPPEMLFASGSGLDPHISPEAAMLQVDRVSKTRNFSNEQKIRLKNRIIQLTEPPQFLFLGQKRINVLLLNLETDKIR
jgi:K+-transporting ATPase ATPase C chain